jgi:hypothetical protein
LLGAVLEKVGSGLQWGSYGFPALRERFSAEDGDYVRLVLVDVFKKGRMASGLGGNGGKRELRGVLYLFDRIAGSKLFNM